MKNNYIGLIFGCPANHNDDECPFQMFRKEEDIDKRIWMWESINDIDFYSKLRLHECCLKKNK